MATMDYWAESPRDREQMALFFPTLDSVISEDDPVRLVDEVPAGLDWSSWEAEYHGKRGQPPIHPRQIAGGILYGMYRGIRSSRKLEESCCYRLDFLWLLEGRQIDHATFCTFRTRFAGPLKDLFKQIGRVAMSLGLIRLLEVGFDGTRVKANNSRYATRTAKTLQEKLAALDELFDRMMSEIEVNDTAETQRRLDGQDDSPTRLPQPLAQLQQRQEQIRAALDQAKAADESRRKKQGTNPEKNPAQVPTTDPDSRVMPNKEDRQANMGVRSHVTSIKKPVSGRQRGWRARRGGRFTISVHESEKKGKIPPAKCGPNSKYGRAEASAPTNLAPPTTPRRVSTATVARQPRSLQNPGRR